jgi:ferredoxin
MSKIADYRMGVTHPRPHTVTLIGQDDATEQFPCPSGKTIEEAARAAGCIVRVVCRRGGCGACRAVLVSGQVEYREPVSITKLRGSPEASNGFELLCRAIPASDVTLRPALAWTKRNPHPWSALTGNARKGVRPWQ